MDSSSIELPGSQVGTVELAEGVLRVHFARALITKTMTGSAERTRWWQAGDLILGGARVEGPLPSGPLSCLGGDIDENIYTYRDMVPIPLESRGWARLALRFEGVAAPLVAEGDAIRLALHEVPKYIEHIR
ncbi:hypothetical protein Thimo_3678 [Thioflavicoccus mobilis 8321]|uniref:Uncharacterized protein n=1 Tax=Thioflavicoccus mobilis 8321 TaxID=765912 RepID=L0H407_9GAMM|nr:hypothetical protein [Thioflavicoccus mobilis]AGA92334.1 hypothetical protein Thimo_3678 [Thioflavicoccus mobilis 8321]